LLTAAHALTRKMRLVAYLKTHGRDKVLFGTNWPMIAPRKALEGLADLAMTDEVAAAFLAGNASRVYRLAAATAANQADDQQAEAQ